MNRNKLIQAVHAAKNRLGLDDETYRACLSSTTGKLSCKDMGEAEIVRVLNAMRRAGFSKKRTVNDEDENAFITDRQRYYIKGLWELVSREKSEVSLHHFIKKRCGVSHLRFLDEKNARAVICALEAMSKKAGFEVRKA